MKFEISHSMSVTHHIKTFHADGSLCREYPPVKNMITDAGLNMLATLFYAQVTACMRIGSGSTTDVKRTITASQSGTTVTATVGTFSAGDASNKRLIVFLDGTQAIVSSYTNTTEVEVDRSQSVLSQSASVYNVEQVALDTEEEASTTYDVLGNAVTKTVTGTTVLLSYSRTGKSTGSYPSGKIVTEIGLAPETTGDLFSRLVLTLPVVIPADGFMTNYHVLNITIDGSTQTLTNPITGITANATARNAIQQSDIVIINSSSSDLSFIYSSGGVFSPSVHQDWCLEPHHCRDGATIATASPYVGVSDDVTAIASKTATHTDYKYSQGGSAAYVAGSFQRVMTVLLYGADFVSAAWRTIAVMTGTNYAYRLLFDADQAFTSGNVLSVVVTKSWKRKT